MDATRTDGSTDTPDVNPSRRAPAEASASPTSVRVWWVQLTDFDVRHLTVLDDAEQKRYNAFRKEIDRIRFALGAVALRRAVAAMVGVGPRSVLVDRRCATCDLPHGRPTLPGTRARASVSHSGALVGVAVADDVAVGLDVECDDGRLDVDTAEAVMAPGETWPRDNAELMKIWTRKESVVKATGDGLFTDLADVRLSAPNDPPVLYQYAGSPLSASVVDLRPWPDHLGAVCVLRAGGVVVQENMGLPPAQG